MLTGAHRLARRSLRNATDVILFAILFKSLTEDGILWAADLLAMASEVCRACRQDFGLEVQSQIATHLSEIGILYYITYTKIQSYNI